MHANSGDECRRDVETAVQRLDGVTADDVHDAASTAVGVSAVPEAYDRSVFESTGIDCSTCAGLVEAALMRLEDVSNATVSHRHGTVGVDYDPESVTEADLRTELTDLGYPVETTDEAFENRRRSQWADARFATGVMAGLMALAPYAAVIYPARFELHDPAVVALLQRALESAFATHFLLNIALLAGIVLGFTGKPILMDAVVSLRERSPNRSLAVATLAVGLYGYSSLVAFSNVGGTIYYDVVIGIVVAATIVRQSGVDEPATAPDEDPQAVDGDRVAADRGGN